MRKRAVIIASALLLACVGGAGFVYARYFYEPGADSAFDTSVAEPALASKRPRVLFDHGHRNIHAIWGRYKPFAELLRADGCNVSTSFGSITEKTLHSVDILVCVNAQGAKPDASSAAFTMAECDAIERWVDGGGSLLLVADHYPCGPAAAALASKFGVVMTGGWTDDPAHAREGSNDPGQLVYSRDKGNLGDHPITMGRTESEQVDAVETFTGQSLVSPAGASVVMPLSSTAIDNIPLSSHSVTKGSSTTTTFDTDECSAAGHCQGLALRHGRGRVVVLAEAAMLTAQVKDDLRFGMNAPGNSNKQFALNTVRWLAGVLGE